MWAFGEAFGAIFAPGLTVLFGAPGAVLIYAVAGALVALPERVWDTPRTGRLILAGTGVFFLGMALLQAWPGRGYWQGTAAGQPGSLTGMVQTMAGTSQPHFLSALVSSFGDFTAAHGWAVNLFAVLAVAGLGAVFCVAAARGDARLARIGVVAGTVLCVADWVLIEDLGFLGGLGTDPNSMIPLILLFTAGWLALTPTRQEAPAMAPAGVVPASVAGAAAEAAVAMPAVSSGATAATTAQGQEVTAQAVAGTGVPQVTASAAGTPGGPGPSANPPKARSPPLGGGASRHIQGCPDGRRRSRGGSAGPATHVGTAPDPVLAARGAPSGSAARVGGRVERTGSGRARRDRGDPGRRGADGVRLG